LTHKFTKPTGTWVGFYSELSKFRTAV